MEPDHCSREVGVERVRLRILLCDREELSRAAFSSAGSSPRPQPAMPSRSRATSGSRIIGRLPIIGQPASQPPPPGRT